jgi:hypothetical protein
MNTEEIIKEISIIDIDLENLDNNKSLLATQYSEKKNKLISLLNLSQHCSLSIHLTDYSLYLSYKDCELYSTISFEENNLTIKPLIEENEEETDFATLQKFHMIYGFMLEDIKKIEEYKKESQEVLQELTEIYEKKRKLKKQNDTLLEKKIIFGTELLFLKTENILTSCDYSIKEFIQSLPEDNKEHSVNDKRVRIEFLTLSLINNHVFLINNYITIDNINTKKESYTINMDNCSKEKFQNLIKRTFFHKNKMIFKSSYFKNAKRDTGYKYGFCIKYLDFLDFFSEDFKQLKIQNFIKC